MAAGSSAPQHSRVHFWFHRNEQRLLALDIVCIALLFFLHLFTSTIETLAPEIVFGVLIAATVLASFIALSVVWKGVVPLVICILGIVLIHNSVILPYYSDPQPGEAVVNGARFTWTLFTPTSVSVASTMNYLLGVAMITFSTVMAYRPSLLFTRNRPESLDDEWSKYPVWADNTLLADGRAEPSVPVKSLMTDSESYLLWRYEYVLAGIYGTAHLVRPAGLVPKGSVLFRDKDSGRVIGKPRYAGFFT